MWQFLGRSGREVQVSLHLWLQPLLSGLHSQRFALSAVLFQHPYCHQIVSPAKGLCHVANQRLQDTSPVHSDCWLCFLPSVDIKSHQIHQPRSNYILKYVPPPQSLENIIFSSQDGLKIEQWLSFKALLQKHLLSQTVDTCTFLKCSKALSSEVKEKCSWKRNMCWMLVLDQLLH